MFDQLRWWDVKQLKTYHNNPEVLLLKGEVSEYFSSSEMKPRSS